MKEFKPSNTQIAALEGNGWTLEDVAATVMHEHHWFVNGGKNSGHHLKMVKVDADRVTFTMVKKFLEDRNVFVKGRKWEVREPIPLEEPFEGREF